MDLSIIIPVYNVEQYLEECLDSVFRIRDIDYEVIILNDGSTDNSLSIINRYSAKRSNVSIISRENRGLSYSRNEGLLKAQGEYVHFLDSDDKIDPHIFAKLFKKGSKINADIIVGNVYLYDGNAKWNYCNVLPKEQILNGEDFLVKYYIQSCSSVVWRSIYKRNFLVSNSLFFVENVYYEDVEWMPKVFFFANKVMMSIDFFYFYRTRLGSICLSDYTPVKLKNSLFLINRMIDFKDKEIKRDSTILIYHILTFSFLFRSMFQAYRAGIALPTDKINSLLAHITSSYPKHRLILFLYHILPNRVFFYLYSKFA